MGAVPLPKLPPVNPVYIAIDAAIIGYEAYTALNNYINRTPNPKGAPDITPIPTSKPKKSSIPNKKQNLLNYSTAMSGLLAAASVGVANFGESGSKAIKQSSEEQSAKSAELLTASGQSPLLANQVHMKDSIDKLIEAINMNALVTATVFGTLDVNLSAIGSSLASISGTLLDISENYSDDTSNTGDVPYINQADYYKSLADSGMSTEQINSYMTQEDAHIQALKNSGVTSYADIKKSVQNWRSQTIPTNYQDTISDMVNGLSSSGWHSATTSNRYSTNGEPVKEVVPNVSASYASNNVTTKLEVPKLEAWAGRALEVYNALHPEYVARELYARMLKSEYAVAPATIRDLDGVVAASASPMELEAIKNATDARLRTDMNNLEFDADDIDFAMGNSLDLSGLFQFERKSTRLINVAKGLAI